MPQAEGAHIVVFNDPLTLFRCKVSDTEDKSAPAAVPTVAATLAILASLAFFGSGMVEPQTAGSAAALLSLSFRPCSLNFLMHARLCLESN
jgi:hypothetical protein